LQASLYVSLRQVIRACRGWRDEASICNDRL
jgi:hypothetical protein